MTFSMAGCAPPGSPILTATPSNSFSEEVEPRVQDGRPATKTGLRDSSIAEPSRPTQGRSAYDSLPASGHRKRFNRAIGLTAVAQFWVTAASPLTVDIKRSECAALESSGLDLNASFDVEDFW